MIIHEQAPASSRPTPIITPVGIVAVLLSFEGPSSIIRVKIFIFFYLFPWGCCDTVMASNIESLGGEILKQFIRQKFSLEMFTLRFLIQTEH